MNRLRRIFPRLLSGREIGPDSYREIREQFMKARLETPHLKYDRLLKGGSVLDPGWPEYAHPPYG